MSALAETLPDRVAVFGDDTIEFYEDPHVYVLRGQVLDGVTGAISQAWPKLYEYSSEFALQRGSAVHRMVELYASDRLDIDTVSPTLMPYLDAFRRFMDQEVSELIEVETIIYSAIHGYAGTRDAFLLDRHNCPILADWKTGDPGWQCGIQTAAYEAADEEQGTAEYSERWGVHLREDGSYRVRQYAPKDRYTDLNDFLAALAVCRRWRRETA